MPPPTPKRPAQAFIDEATAQYRAGRYADAERALRFGAQTHPKNADILFWLGWYLAQSRNIPSGIEMLKRCVALEPARAKAWQELGIMYQHLPDPVQAMAAFERAIFLNPKLVDCYAAGSMVLEKERKRDKARELLVKGLAKNPGDPQLTVFLAQLDVREGRVAEARVALENILATTTDVPALTRGWHTLGAILDQAGECDRAFDAYTRSNQLVLATGPARLALNIADTSTRPEHAAHASIPAAMLQRWASEAPDDGLPSPAFLVGFPRSGTTMVEQVFGAHPRITTFDERPVLDMTETEFRKMAFPGGARFTAENLPAALDSLTPDQIRHLRRYYWDTAKTDSRVDVQQLLATGGILVDKFPTTIVRLGFINRIFPASRVVVLLRDPRDCCLSGYFQRFGINPGMVHFLTVEGAGLFYESVMGNWLMMRQRLTLKLFELKYEDTTRDFPPIARKLIDFLSLEWHDDVLAFHEKAAKKYISTPSANAVAKPVNTKSVARWKKFERHLQPLKPHVDRFIEAFGYEPW